MRKSRAHSRDSTTPDAGRYIRVGGGGHWLNAQVCAAKHGSAKAERLVRVERDLAHVPPHSESDGKDAKKDDQGGHLGHLFQLRNFAVFVKVSQRHAVRQEALKPEDVRWGNPSTRNPLLESLVRWIAAHLSGKGGRPAVMADQASNGGRVVCFHSCSVPQQKRVVQVKRVMTRRLVAAKVLA